MVRRSLCEREIVMFKLDTGAGRFDVHRAVTDRIVAAIEAGAARFQMPWHRVGPGIGRPVNALTGVSYRGVNVVALWAEAVISGYGCGVWASYRQWCKLGAQVRRGEQGAIIVFYKSLAGREDDADDEQPSGPLLLARATRVFNADQVIGWKESERPSGAGADPLVPVERFIAATEAQIRHGGRTACYRPREDVIEIPPREQFLPTAGRSASEGYYGVLLHELTHWSGASHRLARTFGDRFGDAAYAVEELVAELGAAFLCADLGVSNALRPDHAAYVADWLAVLKHDRKAVFLAARLANQAVEYLHQLQS